MEMDIRNIRQATEASSRGGRTEIEMLVDLIKTIRQLAGVQKGQKIVVFWIRIQQQQDGTFCGFHAVANLVAVIHGSSPAMQKLDATKLRQSLK